MDNKHDRKVLMVCTAAKGGIRSVVEGYKEDGLFERWNIELLYSHVEGDMVSRLAAAIKAYIRMLYLLGKRQVKLLHCHSAMKGSFWRKCIFSLTARAMGVPVIFHLHGSEMKTFVEGQPVLVKKLISWILKNQDAVVVLSDSWRRYVKSIAPKADIVVIPNYVDIPKGIAAMHRSNGSSEPLTIVLFLGEIGKRKGIYDLLPAFKDALQRVPRLHLVVGGEGEIEKAQALAYSLNINRHVNFMGWVSGKTKLALLRSAHIYVLPSYNEGLPMSLIEAMSWGVPVVATRVGGIPELVHNGVQGFLIDPGDRSGLSEAIIELARDKDKRAEMGLSGRVQIQTNYSKRVVCPKLDRLYKSLLSVK